MKRIIAILILLVVVGYWQWPAIAGWWDQRQADRAAEELTDDELNPELEASEEEIDQAFLEAEAELDALEQQQ